MRFLRPEQLIWVAAVAVPLLLYLVRRRPRTVEITTLSFFKSLSRAYRESSWLRRLKRILSLLLTLLMVAAAVGVLARAVVSPGSGTLAGLVILVDRSGSMGAVDADGRTRLDEAMQLVRRRLAGIPAAVPVSVIAYDAQPEVLLPLSHERRSVERTLSSITERPVQGDPVGAMQLAELVARLADPAVIWHVTDTPGPDLAAIRPGDDGHDHALRIEQFCVALPEPVNAGLTAFEIRTLPLQRGRVEAFVQVEGTTPEPLEIQLDVYLDGVLTSVRTMTLAAGRRERLLIPVDAARVQALGPRRRVSPTERHPAPIDQDGAAVVETERRQHFDARDALVDAGAQIKLGLELCTKAIKKEFYKAEYYRNLARVYIAADNKKGAITTLTKGMKYETESEMLHEMLVELGVRSRPTIPFLKRSNIINKYLGILIRRTIPQMLRRKGPSKQ